MDANGVEFTNAESNDDGNVGNDRTANGIQNNDQFKSTHDLLVALAISSIGNLFQWFDFSIIGLITTEIGRNFFPNDSSEAQILKSFAIFAGAFFMRPVGAALFGYIGDKHGRVISLRISLFMMAIATFLTGCLPTYSSIGILAPILLCTFRLLQGISTGGEFSGAMTYVLEVCPPKQKAFFTTMVQVSGNCGNILAVIFIGVMREIFTVQQLNEYGWRIPFLFGFIIAVFGFWIRKGLKPSHEFMIAKNTGQTFENPTKEIFINHKAKTFIVFIHVLYESALYFFLWTWLPQYTLDKAINPIKSVYLINSINMVISMSVMSIWSILIDRYFNSDPTKSLIFFGTISMGFGLIVCPFISEINTIQFVFIQLIWGVIDGLYHGGWSLWGLLRLGNHAAIRHSAFGIGYNSAEAFFGGSSPFIATVLVLNYQPWTLGVLLFIYGSVSIGTNIVWYSKNTKNVNTNSEAISEVEPLIHQMSL